MATKSHPVFARMYERLSPVMDRNGVAEHRALAVAGLSGRVLEIGAGNGLMFAHYPAEVTEVVAVEPEPHLRSSAKAAALTAPVKVTVLDGVAESLPAADDEFDAAVAALVLCSVPDQAVALTELHRALRPGGELRFFEHVAAPAPGRLSRVQRLVDATIWPFLLAGCHTSRDTAAAITTAGFTIEDIDRFTLPAEGPQGPAAPHIRGRARKP